MPVSVQGQDFRESRWGRGKVGLRLGWKHIGSIEESTRHLCNHHQCDR